MIPNIKASEERAAIAEYDGGELRSTTEDLAAHQQEFLNRDHYWQWLADYLVTRNLSI